MAIAEKGLTDKELYTDISWILGYLRRLKLTLVQTGFNYESIALTRLPLE